MNIIEKSKQFVWIALLFLFCCLNANAAGQAIVLTIEGPIGPATSDYLQQAIERAETEETKLIILQIDTPGGLDNAMRDIIKRLLTTPIPVVSYVSPSGARAASAGTYILYASHIAAMAPGTNLGAATPVQLGGLPGLGSDQQSDNDTHSTMEHKLVNDASAYLRSLAQMRGRNIDWAEQAVRQAASLPAEEALALGVIDLVAKDIPELLQRLDGWPIQQGDQQIQLETSQLTLVEIAPDWRHQLLAIIANPNIAYILMLVGLYGLIYEFSNPGAILPGTIGAIALLLALYAFQLLPVDYTGLGLMLLGLVLLIAEAFVPSFGMLGIGGLAAFVIGSFMLINTDVPGYALSTPLVLGVAIVTGGFILFTVGMAIQARQRPIISGREQMVGLIGEALTDFTSEGGQIQLRGEIWSATSQQPVRAKQPVRVTQITGLTLTVIPIEKRLL